MKKWICTFCGDEAEAHYCTDYTDRKHIYMCHDCHNQYLGWKPVKNPKMKKYIVASGHQTSVQRKSK